MGVPRLFPFTKKTFYNAVKYFKQGEHTQTVDHLLIDANCLLHAACQEVYHYGSNTSIIDRHKELTEKEKLRKVCDLFFEALRKIVAIIYPRKVLYLTLDGPAPLAKQAQQRQRRFVSSRTRLEAENSEGISKFDSNSITPGTLFMHEVTKYMNYAIRHEINSVWLWRKFQVHFSPCTVPGEGEHKLMDYIRSLPYIQRKRESFCMFGPDGDLIMLTLSAHVPKMWLFREDQYNLDHFHLLDMGKIRRDMAQIFPKAGRVSVDVLIDEFIFLGFFVGNDFLPKVQMFHLLEDGLEMMIATHAKLGIFMTKGGKISSEKVKIFIDEIAKSEKEFIQEQTKSDPSRRSGEKFRNNTLFSHMHNGVLNMANYRKAYYLKSGISDDREIEVMCKDYFRTLVWVFEYYVSGLPSWRWLYPWHYAPLMSDLAITLNKLSSSEFKELTTFKLENASRPFVQLLSVLPTTSKTLLPRPYRKLMENGPLIKAGNYPNPCSFKIDYEGKFQEYQGIAILPFVDYDTVSKAYERLRLKIK